MVAVWYSCCLDSMCNDDLLPLFESALSNPNCEKLGMTNTLAVTTLRHDDALLYFVAVDTLVQHRSQLL
jgi:hypothetical protein